MYEEIRKLNWLRGKWVSYQENDTSPAYVLTLFDGFPSPLFNNIKLPINGVCIYGDHSNIILRQRYLPELPYIVLDMQTDNDIVLAMFICDCNLKINLT